MGKIIVPKNHILSGTTSHRTAISSSTVTLNAEIAPEFIYEEHYVIVHRTINYTPTTGLLNTTSNVSYRVNLFDSISEDNKEVRFIKLTLTNFPIYIDNRTPPTGSIRPVVLTANINIHKKYNSSADCTITKRFASLYGQCGINGTYWLVFDPSTKKYVYYSAIDGDEPLLASKAIVPNRDNWLEASTVVTRYAPPISTSMSINTGEFYNQPYIGRRISINNVPDVATTITSRRTYNLNITTNDKILIINSIYLGNFLGPVATGSTAPSSFDVIFNIFINGKSTAVYTKTTKVKGVAAGSVPFAFSLGTNTLYIDVENNKIISSLDKAIDSF